MTNLTFGHLAIGILLGWFLFSLGVLSYRLLKWLINRVRSWRKKPLDIAGGMEIAIIDFHPDSPLEYKGKKHPGIILIKPHKNDSEVIAEVEDDSNS